MKVELSTWQRLMLTQLVGEQRGPVSVIRKASKLLDTLEMTNEENFEIGLVQDAQVGFTWQDNEKRWELEIPGGLVPFLQDVVKNHDAWSARFYGEVLDLFEQLEIEEEEIA